MFQPSADTAATSTAPLIAPPSVPQAVESASTSGAPVAALSPLPSFRSTSASTSSHSSQRSYLPSAYDPRAYSLLHYFMEELYTNYVRPVCTIFLAPCFVINS